MVSSARLHHLCVIRSVPPENTLSTGTLVANNKYKLIDFFKNKD